MFKTGSPLLFFLWDIPHSLSEERVSPSLANDKISPLNNHDGHKECRLACVLQALAIFVSLEKK